MGSSWRMSRFRKSLSANLSVKFNNRCSISQMAGSKTMNMTVCLTDRNQSVMCLLACEQLGKSLHL